MSRGRAATVELAGSSRAAPEEAVVAGEVEPDEPLTLTLHFRRRTPPVPPGSAEDLRRLTRPMTHSVLRRERARTHSRAAKRIEAFARSQGITVRDIDLTRRKMVLEAPAGLLMSMFGATIRLYDNGTETFQARTGVLHIPREIAPWTRAVVGFDQRPLPHCAVGDATDGLWPTDVAALYGIPLDRDVSSQRVGVITMGGGYQASDLAHALDGMKRKPPAVTDVSVGGVTNQFGDGSTNGEQEIALDLQILAALLPGAHIAVYFTGNTAEALANAIDQAVHDEVNRPQVLSISWGSPEFYWTDPRREVVCGALCDAARLRITVVTAAGDQLATSGLTDGKAHVWFPASCPYVIGCGGTSVSLAGAVIEAEAVWNEEVIGTGGGISDNYPVPDFQLGAALPPSVNDGRKGRGVPDVAALAAKSPGYRIVIGGVETAKDGTSAATPLWAGLFAIANAQRHTPLGLVAPSLYQSPHLMRPITDGNNRQNGIGYAAGNGWSACTGLGVPRGGEIITALEEVPVA